MIFVGNTGTGRSAERVSSREANLFAVIILPLALPDSPPAVRAVDATRI